MAAEAPADTFYASIQARYFDGLDIKYPWFSFHSFSPAILKPGGSEFFPVFNLRVCTSNNQRPQFWCLEKDSATNCSSSPKESLAKTTLNKDFVISISYRHGFLASTFGLFLDSLSWIIRMSNNISLITSFTYFSNSFINPIVYALRIPDFKEALSLCCFTRHEVMSSQENAERDEMAADLAPLIQRRTLTMDHNNLKLTFEQQNVQDTKL